MNRSKNPEYLPSNWLTFWSLLTKIPMVVRSWWCCGYRCGVAGDNDSGKIALATMLTRGDGGTTGIVGASSGSGLRPLKWATGICGVVVPHGGCDGVGLQSADLEVERRAHHCQ